MWERRSDVARETRAWAVEAQDGREEASRRFETGLPVPMGRCLEKAARGGGREKEGVSFSKTQRWKEEQPWVGEEARVGKSSS